MIRTTRLKLLPWRDEHRAPFAEMHADPIVMQDQGGPIGRAESDAKLDRYSASYAEHGLARWAVETVDGDFLGYAGVMPRLASDHPLGAHFEIGWRFMHRAWGQGYASESAAAALCDAFRRAGLREVVAYTSADNLRSRAVMAQLELQRDPSRDFTAEYAGVGLWRGLVWVALSTPPPPEANGAADRAPCRPRRVAATGGRR
jgi:RimJ/RimL family protein N-acetyltransferase